MARGNCRRECATWCPGSGWQVHGRRVGELEPRREWRLDRTRHHGIPGVGRLCSQVVFAFRLVRGDHCGARRNYGDLPSAIDGGYTRAATGIADGSGAGTTRSHVRKRCITDLLIDGPRRVERNRLRGARDVHGVARGRREMSGIRGLVGRDHCRSRRQDGDLPGPLTVATPVLPLEYVMAPVPAPPDAALVNGASPNVLAIGPASANAIVWATGGGGGGGGDGAFLPPPPQPASGMAKVKARTKRGPEISGMGNFPCGDRAGWRSRSSLPVLRQSR